MRTLNYLLLLGIIMGVAGCGERPQQNSEQQSGPNAKESLWQPDREPANYPESAFRGVSSPSQSGSKLESASLGSIEYLDAKSGFRHVTFGQLEDSLPDFVLKSSDEKRGLKTYIRKEEDLTLNGVPLKAIEYTFLNGQLFQVAVKWHVEEKNAVLKNSSTVSLAPYCASLYGPAKRHSSSKDSDNYVWRGKQVELILNEASFSGVRDQVRGGWAVPPSTKGLLLIQSIELRNALDGTVAKAEKANAGF